MANITKQPKILSFEKVAQIEKLLGLDGICANEGTYILSSKSGRLLVLYEIETTFSKIKENHIANTSKKVCKR